MRLLSYSFLLWLLIIVYKTEYAKFCFIYILVCLYLLLLNELKEVIQLLYLVAFLIYLKRK